VNCPNCSKPRPENAEECASCGVVFAKWRERWVASAASGAAAAPAPAPEPAAAPSSAAPILIVITLALAAGAWHLMRPDESLPASPRARGSFDPEPYRRNIDMVEDEVYSDSPDANPAQSLQGPLLALAQNLRAEGSREGIRAGEGLEAWAGRLVEPPADGAPADPAAVRDRIIGDWETFRAKTFYRAIWFRRKQKPEDQAAPEQVAAPAAAAPPGAAPAKSGSEF